MRPTGEHRGLRQKFLKTFGEGRSGGGDRERPLTTYRPVHSSGADSWESKIVCQGVRVQVHFYFAKSQRLRCQNYASCRQKCGGQSWFRTSTMPQNRHTSRDAFDVDLLDPQALDTPDGLRTAIRVIEAVCHRGGSEIEEMVETLNSRTDVLEYFISGMLSDPQALARHQR